MIRWPMINLALSSGSTLTSIPTHPTLHKRQPQKRPQKQARATRRASQRAHGSQFAQCQTAKSSQRESCRTLPTSCPHRGPRREPAPSPAATTLRVSAKDCQQHSGKDTPHRQIGGSPAPPAGSVRRSVRRPAWRFTCNRVPLGSHPGTAQPASPSAERPGDVPTTWPEAPGCLNASVTEQLRRIPGLWEISHTLS